MRTKLTLVILLTITVSCLMAQKTHKGDTIRIESETVKLQIPEKKIPEIKIQIPPEEVTRVETSIQKELKEYITEMQDQKFISDNVITEVNVEKDSNDLKLVYSYYLINDTLKFQTDDFGLGKYRVNESNALLVTLEIMKKTLEGQLVKYVKPQTRISLTINGRADATPIRGTLEYRGEYGNPVSGICRVEESNTRMEVSEQQGIPDNLTLAFIRSIAVKDYIDKNIEPLHTTDNSWNYSASVSAGRGGQYRRVSIEVIIYGAFKN